MVKEVIQECLTVAITIPKCRSPKLVTFPNGRTVRSLGMVDHGRKGEAIGRRKDHLRRRKQSIGVQVTSGNPDVVGLGEVTAVIGSGRASVC